MYYYIFLLSVSQSILQHIAEWIVIGGTDSSKSGIDSMIDND